MVRITGSGEKMKVRPMHQSHHPFDDGLHARLVAVMDDDPSAAGLLPSLDHDVTAAMIETARATIKLEGVPANKIAVVGLGGAVITHTARDPKHNTLAYVTELGSVPFAAGRLGTPVVGQFAQSDAGAGGCGGPITAWADWLLFRDKQLSRVLIHLGGLVTLTQVGTNAHPLEVVAFDVGPGTMLMDALTRELIGRPADVDGAFADRGRPSASMLNELLANPYFRAPAPKVTHRRNWSGAHLTRLRAMAQRHRVREEDVVATATEWVAHSVAQGVKLLTERPHEIILTGGGARNIHLASRIRTLLSPSSTINCEKFGIGIRAKQAICMAVLAAARLDKTPIYCPYATGAKAPTIWGSLCE